MYIYTLHQVWFVEKLLGPVTFAIHKCLSPDPSRPQDYAAVRLGFSDRLASNRPRHVERDPNLSTQAPSPVRRQRILRLSKSGAGREGATVKKERRFVRQGGDSAQVVDVLVLAPLGLALSAALPRSGSYNRTTQSYLGCARSESELSRVHVYICVKCKC